MKTNITSMISLALIAALMSACGSTYRETQLERPQAIMNGTGDTNSPTTPPVLVTPAVTPIPFTPTYTTSFVMSGIGGTMPTATVSGILTDTILKVRVVAGAASNLALPSTVNGGYSNFSASYSCVRYTIEAAGQTKTTGILSVDGSSTMNLCPNAPSEEVMDFSTGLTSGNETVTVTVKSAKYDYYCQLLLMGYIWGGYYNTYCSNSLYPVYRTHTVTGNLDLEVNGF